MGFWLFMLITDLLIPVCLLVLGRRFVKIPPREISRTFGYRTTMSMKNMDTWVFAHRYAGRIWFAAGLVLLPISVVVMLLARNADTDTLALVCGGLCILQIIPAMGVIVPTEMALHKAFDKDGNRR